MRYIVRVETKSDVLYLYVINHNTPALTAKWEDATFFRTKEEAIHGFSLIRQNFSLQNCGIISMEVRKIKVLFEDEIVAKEML